MADSIGSKARRWLARTAYSSTGCSASGRPRELLSPRSCSASAAQSLRTAIRFMVKVPVLSTHSTVVAPSSSTAGMLRVSTFSRASLQAPRPRKMVNTTGSSSGRMAIANVRPASSPCSQSPRIRPQASASTAARPNPIAATQVTMRWVSRWTGVASVEMACSEAPMRPRALRSPVAVTMPRPVPCVTSVPEKAWLRATGPASDAALCVCFITGADSPVNSDSSIDRLDASIKPRSAGTRSPSASRTMSPTTSSRPVTRIGWPSRTTSARGLDRSRSASRDCSLRRFWT